MKKIIKILSILFLVCFSFYYTEKSVDLVKYADPIMKEIKINANTLSLLDIIENVDIEKYCLRNRRKFVLSQPI